jgi:hypothetical protein
LFERLKEKLKINMDQIVKTIRSPTEKTVKDLLWSDDGQQLHGSRSPSRIGGAFKATVRFKGPYTVEAECLLPAKGKKLD